jgi:1-acyl-sn-glycerol-3-phosphate acyltransferase
MPLPWSAFGDAIVQSSQIFQNTMAHADQPWDGRNLGDRDPEAIQALMPLLGWMYEHYFPATTTGLEQIPDEKFLMVGSHNGGLAAPDLFLLMWAWFQEFGLVRPTYGLMNAKMWTGYPLLARVAAQMGAVRATPKMAIAALKADASVLVYPGGARDVFRPYALRHQIFLNGNFAFIKLALRESVPIVPVVSLGAHDTLRVIADLYPLLQKLHQRGMPWLLDLDPEVWPVFLGWPWGIGVGPLLNIPFRKPIQLRIGAPIYFERTGAQATKDQAYILRCYDQVHQQMQLLLNQLVVEDDFRKLTP